MLYADFSSLKRIVSEMRQTPSNVIHTLSTWGVFKMHGSLITPFRLGITGTPEGDENNRGTVPVTAAAFIYQHVTSALVSSPFSYTPGGVNP
ncbi:hypothetical protein CDAR_436661 [Caerostris darwini]|uniref:Uncharacterized protein n=1 Tax=Caerostris darwini TaxID=1538125 RepID=A0AAV4SBH8_9ARAC|nr:hypothetical protein CDAR_436661 [Caerostris darwini]